jgi:ATP-dependent DNA helicase DinG
LAKREAAIAQGLDPYLAVDLPAMSIKLRQGIGRLIRSRQDHGTVVLLEGGNDPQIRQHLLELLPAGVPISADPLAVRDFVLESSSSAVTKTGNG